MINSHSMVFFTSDSSVRGSGPCGLGCMGREYSFLFVLDAFWMLFDPAFGFENSLETSHLFQVLTALHISGLAQVYFSSSGLSINQRVSLNSCYVFYRGLTIFVMNSSQLRNVALLFHCFRRADKPFVSSLCTDQTTSG